MTGDTNTASGRARLGAALIALGLLTIVGAVVWMLEVANGPGTGPTEFARRRGYDRTKEALHDALPAGLAVAGVGLALALVGGRLRNVARSEEADRLAG